MIRKKWDIVYYICHDSSSSPSFTKGLSSPAITPSHNGHDPASSSSNSSRAFSIFFDISFLSPLFPPLHIRSKPILSRPVDHIPAETTVAKDSGTIKSRSLSPAERIFRLNELAARALFCTGAVKVAESKVLCPTPWLAALVANPGIGDVIEGRSMGNCCVPFTRSFCNAIILLNDAAERYSLAYLEFVIVSTMFVYFHICITCTHQSNKTINMECMLARKDVKLARQ